MHEISLKPEAENDLAKIFEYTYSNWGIEQADKYQDELFSGMQRLGNQINLGKEYPFTNKPYRFLNVNRHLIFYRIENKVCVVIRILHDKMDIQNHLK